LNDNDRKRKIEKLSGDAEPDATEQDGGSLPDSVVLKTMPCDPFQAFPLWTVMSALLLHFALHWLFTWKVLPCPAAD
jgi:hypothetical protein